MDVLLLLIVFGVLISCLVSSFFYLLVIFQGKKQNLFLKKILWLAMLLGGISSLISIKLAMFVGTTRALGQSTNEISALFFVVFSVFSGVIAYKIVEAFVQKEDEIKKV